MSRIAFLGSRELFVVAVAVIALGTATLAQAVGVSVALGAFLAGLALADSDLAASVLGEVVPLRELFATIFFVSVGILLEPAAIVAGWPIVLLLLVLIVAGKALPMAALLRLAGHQPGTALRAAGLVAQGGEFSFVLAAVGLQLGALDATSFSEAMGAVVLSIVVAAPVARIAALLGAALERRAPPSHLGEAELPPGLRRHVVLLGVRSVGRSVARVLEARSIPWLSPHAAYPLVELPPSRRAPAMMGTRAPGPSSKPSTSTRRPRSWWRSPIRSPRARRSSTPCAATGGCTSSFAPIPRREGPSCSGWGPPGSSPPNASSAVSSRATRSPATGSASARST